VVIYVAVNLFLIVLNLRNERHHIWFYWPMLGCSGTAGMFIPIAGIRRAKIE